MDCLYAKDLNKNLKQIKLSSDESKHSKALRLKIGDEILVTNGDGLTALCKLNSISKQGNTLDIIEFYHNYNEIETQITLAFGVLDNSERIEFIVEKATELGVVEIVPLITQYSNSSKLRLERLESKAIAALKQSKRSRLPAILETISFSDLVHNLDSWDSIILADENGESKLNLKNSKNILILCGPEGGFSDEERDIILRNANTQSIKLSNTRLRTETASISMLSNIIFNLL